MEMKDKAKDLLYMHDTIEVFSENLDELQKLFRGDGSKSAASRFRKGLQDRRIQPLTHFSASNDTTRGFFPGNLPAFSASNAPAYAYRR
jgi:hypothetical protein